MARPSYQVRCPECDAPYVAPRRDAEVSGQAMVNCRCGYSGIQPTSLLKKDPPARKPRKPLKRGSSLKTSKKARRSQLAGRLSKRWREGVGRVCANCGREADWVQVFIEGHHVVRQSLIKARAKEEDWTQEELDRRLWDERNRMDLCRDCHLGKQHNGKPLAWSLIQKVTPKAIQFAREIGLLRRVSREYVGGPQ